MRNGPASSTSTFRLSSKVLTPQITAGFWLVVARVQALVAADGSGRAGGVATGKGIGSAAGRPGQTWAGPNCACTEGVPRKGAESTFDTTDTSQTSVEKFSAPARESHVDEDQKDPKADVAYP